MKNYEITFEWPNGDWTWIDVEANDYHQAMLIGLDRCPLSCRVHNIQFFTREQVEASSQGESGHFGATDFNCRTLELTLAKCHVRHITAPQ